MHKTSAIGAAILAASAASIPTTTAIASSTIEVQVSRALQEDWHSTLNAAPGDSIDIRVRISYTGGTQTPLGFGSAVFQPTVSNWKPGQDSLTALINGGAGGQFSTPIGAVPDAPGQYGRLTPFVQVGMPASAALKGHVNTVAATTYLRIAQAQVTSWFGGSGNTGGGSGINMHQMNIAGAERDHFGPNPPFTSDLTGLVMFKFNIVLGAATDLRTLVIDTPLAGINSQATGPYVGWYMAPTEQVPTFQDRSLTIVPATISVPTPGAAMALVAAPLFVRRRRR